MGADERLAELARLVRELGPALEPPGAGELLQGVAEAARTTLDAAACSIALLIEEEGSLVFLAAAGEGAERVTGSRMRAGDGIAGWVVASGQSITVSDTATDPRFAADVAASTGYVPASLLAIPLARQDDVVGVMEILDARAGGADQERTVALLAEQAALALHTVLLFQDLAGALFTAVAAAGRDTDLGEALVQAGANARGPQRQLDELAWLFYELGRLGPDERAGATQLLHAFLGYARGAAPQP